MIRKQIADVTWKYNPGILGTAEDTTINRNQDSLLTSQRLRIKCATVKEEDEGTAGLYRDGRQLGSPDERSRN